MIKKILTTNILVILFIFVLNSCGINTARRILQKFLNKVKHKTQLLKGRALSSGLADNKASRDLQMKDAQNRLQSSGGLLGKKSLDLGSLKLDNQSSDQKIASIGMLINPYLWRGSLETISFMPLAICRSI